MRNIIICCDGTGNEISENISNVLKLYRCLRKTEKTQPRQLVFYDPGVGTLERPDPWHKLKQDFNAILGLATGYGLDDNVLAAYAFLVHNYQHGDAIYLFGFSRGAYTVRVLAGLIHKIGLITPEQVNLAGSGLIAYKQFSSDEAPKLRARLTSFADAGAEDAVPPSPFDNAAQFARITSSRWPTIRFLGVWDTVASVIVPRPDRFYLPSLLSLPLPAKIRASKRSARRSRSTSGGGCFACTRGASRRSSCITASARPTMKSRRIVCRCGSPACMATSAAAIPSEKAGCQNFR